MAGQINAVNGLNQKDLYEKLAALGQMPSNQQLQQTNGIQTPPAQQPQEINQNDNIALSNEAMNPTNNNQGNSALPFMNWANQANNNTAPAAEGIGGPAAAPQAAPTAAAPQAAPTANAQPAGGGEKLVEVKVGKWGSGKNDCVWNALKGQGWTDKEISAKNLVDKVAKLNNLKDPNKVKDGQTLKIPAKDGANQANQTPNAAPAAPQGVQGANATPAVNNAQGANGAQGANATPGVTGNQLVNPIDPGSYKVTSEFGPRFDGMHIGIDLGAHQGTPIKAVSNGTISKVGNDPKGYGNWVELTHDDGTKSRYGHMSQFGNIQEGQKVKAGSVLGLVGSTGRSTGPHLHFEYRDKQNNPVNPRQAFNF